MSRDLWIRLTKLQMLLRGRSVINASALARELNVTVRSIRRDIVALRKMGMRIWHDQESGGYRIQGDYFLPPTQFTLGEALALSILGGQLARRGQIPFMEDAWQAITKIRSQLPAATRDSVADADESVRIDAACVSPQEDCKQHMATFHRAIETRRKVSCIYLRGSGDALDRKTDKRPFLFQPYSLYFGQRAWYAIGHSEKSGGERTLKLNRFQSVERTDAPYEIPKEWSVEKCFGKAWRMIRANRIYLVRIRFDAEHAQNVADTLWHPTQRIAWETDGSCLFECDVDGLDEIVWWALGHGPYAEVVAPIELRQKVQEMTQQVLKRYQAKPTVHRRRPAPPRSTANARSGHMVYSQ